ncbi:hypothetical protein BLOT_016244 [Blomia tropicalis]|nr:hypothetical protein BLOT_016244 [Blomia tropicalis]
MNESTIDDNMTHKFHIFSDGSTISSKTYHLDVFFYWHLINVSPHLAEVFVLYRWKIFLRFAIKAF